MISTFEKQKLFIHRGGEARIIVRVPQCQPLEQKNAQNMNINVQGNFDSATRGGSEATDT